MIDWGSVPDWVAAVSTTLALVGAVVAARSAIGAARQQSKQLELLEQEARDRETTRSRIQASGVATWIRVSRSDAVPEVMWINSSGLPIFDLTIFVVTPHAFTGVDYFVIGPAASPRAEMSRTTEALRAAHAPDTHWLHMMDNREIRSAAIFRDAEEQIWFRDYNGTLHIAASRSNASAQERAARPWHQPSTDP